MKLWKIFLKRSFSIDFEFGNKTGDRKQTNQRHESMILFFFILSLFFSQHSSRESKEKRWSERHEELELKNWINQSSVNLFEASISAQLPDPKKVKINEFTSLPWEDSKLECVRTVTTYTWKREEEERKLQSAIRYFLKP